MDFDLNLLRVFDTLMELRSVTRAAERLGLTQSAVSHTLSRLRTVIGDPLFVRSGRGLLPTVRAEEIAPGVRQGLQRLAESLSPKAINIGDAPRRFTISAGHYVCALLIPQLIARAREIAPGVSFQVLPFGDDLTAALDRGSVDLAFAAVSRAPGRFIIEPFLVDELVWIAAADNPIARQKMTAAEVATLPQVALMARLPFDAPRATGESESLAVRYGAGFPLDDANCVYDAQTAIAVAASTELIAQVPRRMAMLAGDRIAILAAFEDPIAINLIWHTRNANDPGVIWLRGVLQSLIPH